MSRDFNKVIMTGRLARDFEIISTASGDKLAKNALLI